MDDSVLWVVALGVGAAGFLLLALAGLIAMYINTKPPSAQDQASSETPEPEAKHEPPAKKTLSQAQAEASTRKTSPPIEDTARIEDSPSQVAPSRARRKTVGGFWAWVKAWVFALVHAGTVSMMLGGITFFEDLANASEEIQETGTVTFPKQLLPGTLAGPASRARLTSRSGGLLREGRHEGNHQRDEATANHNKGTDSGQPDIDPPNTPGWEVVDPAS